MELLDLVVSLETLAIQAGIFKSHVLIATKTVILTCSSLKCALQMLIRITTCLTDVLPNNWGDARLISLQGTVAKSRSPSPITSANHIQETDAVCNEK